MEKLPAVESAKELLTEAVAWSVMRWLREKKRVRKVADQANDALDQLEQAVKDRWPERIKTAYAAVLVHTPTGNTTSHGRKQSCPPTIDSQSLLSVKNVKEADNEAQNARMDAEQTFDIAEKQLSTALAREGCRKAIRSWELYEKAIRKAETLISPE